MRWVGPYCNDGSGWRRATSSESIGRSLLSFSERMDKAGYRKNAFFDMLQKGARIEIVERGFDQVVG